VADVTSPQQPASSLAGAFAALTPRQLSILPLIADGLSNAEIAQRLSLSRSTVAQHVSDLLERTGANGRTHLISLAFRSGTLHLYGSCSSLLEPPSRADWYLQG
jgi:DNA-binding NarL/FixJ family response regulator